MRRAFAAALTVAIAGGLLVACPRAGGEVARPVPVELDWPDAAVPGGAPDAGQAIQPGTLGA